MSPVQSSLPTFYSYRHYSHLLKSSSAPRPSEAKVEECEEARKMLIGGGSPRQGEFWVGVDYLPCS